MSCIFAALGLNINFHEPTLIQGVKRIVSNLE